MQINLLWNLHLNGKTILTLPYSTVLKFTRQRYYTALQNSQSNFQTLKKWILLPIKNTNLHIISNYIFTKYYTPTKNPQFQYYTSHNIFNEKKHHESWKKLFIPNKNHIAFYIQPMNTSIDPFRTI